MKTALIAAALLAAAPASPPRDYVVGQVWEYDTRPQDSGSLIRIQRMETVGGTPIYHIGFVGLTLAGRPGQSVAHTPVARETLDRSVTRLSTLQPPFPDPEEGIEEWRSANGGVFNITLREIAGIIDQALQRRADSNQ